MAFVPTNDLLPFTLALVHWNRCNGHRDSRSMKRLHTSIGQSISALVVAQRLQFLLPAGRSSNRKSPERAGWNADRGSARDRDRQRRSHGCHAQQRADRRRRSRSAEYAHRRDADRAGHALCRWQRHHARRPDRCTAVRQRQPDPANRQSPADARRTPGQRSGQRAG